MNPYTLSDDEVVRLCRPHNVQQSQILSAELSGRKVVKLTDRIVVKFGLGVTPQEAKAQQLAFQKVDGAVLRIPQVYCFFARRDAGYRSIGYLVMEYINGTSLEHVDWEATGMLPRVVASLNAVHSISGKYAGPVSGGDAHGNLWSEYGSGTKFSNVTDLESYLNERLAYFKIAIHVPKEDLCLCHMDVAPRNFMIDLQGDLCLLDWATAGFYPRYFELWSIDFTQHVMGSSFGLELLQSLGATTAEMLEVQKLSLVYRFNARGTM